MSSISSARIDQTAVNVHGPWKGKQMLEGVRMRSAEAYSAIMLIDPVHMDLCDELNKRGLHRSARHCHGYCFLADSRLQHRHCKANPTVDCAQPKLTLSGYSRPHTIASVYILPSCTLCKVNESECCQPKLVREL